MFISTEATPNPQTLKFLPGRSVLGAGTAEFTDADQAAAASPLAESLFRVDGVRSVFLGGDFVTITKDDEARWPEVKAQVLASLMTHFTSGAPVMLEQAATQSADQADAEDGPVVRQIKELLDTRVRPAVAQDGGDIVFHSFKEDTGTVFLTMRGSCSGCPSSTATLKHGIENLLRHYVPEVREVEAVL